MRSTIKKRLGSRIAAALLVFIVLVTSFAWLLEEVREGDTLQLDETVLRAINTTSSPFWDRFYLIATDTGGLPFIAIATALIATLLLASGRKYLAVFVSVAVAGAGLINLVLKIFVGRERPSLWQQLITESSNSFPSGHAMASSILALCIVLVLWRSKYRWVVVGLSGLYVVLVGYSRMYLGVHYPSDIIAGWIISSAWFITVGAILYGRLWRSRKPQDAIESQE